MITDQTIIEIPEEGKELKEIPVGCALKFKDRKEEVTGRNLENCILNVEEIKEDEGVKIRGHCQGYDKITNSSKRIIQGYEKVKGII